MFKQWYLEIWEKLQEQEFVSQEIHQQEKINFMENILMNAQGEDVVAGIRTPLEIAELEKHNARMLQRTW